MDGNSIERSNNTPDSGASSNYSRLAQEQAVAQAIQAAAESGSVDNFVADGGGGFHADAQHIDDDDDDSDIEDVST
jgi:hypothetical protein